MLRAVSTGLMPDRRPNTAALQEHRKPWTPEKLQGFVTSNCVGTSAWKSTMNDLDQFTQRFASLTAAADDDVDDASSTATGQKDNIGGMRRLADPPKLQPLQRVNLLYSVGSIPDDSVLLKGFRALSALQGAVLRRRQIASPGDAALLARVLKMMTVSENLQLETKAMADVKVLYKSSFVDRIANVIRAENGKGVGAIPGSAIPFFDIFSAFDCCRDGYVAARPFQAAVAFVDAPSSSSFIKYFFVTVHTFNSNVHIAEMRTAIQLLNEIADAGGDLRSTSAKPQLASSAANLHVGSRDQVDGEFRHWCDAAFPNNGASGSRERQLVDVVKWSDLRATICNDTAFDHLAAIVAENSLY